MSDRGLFLAGIEDVVVNFEGADGPFALTIDSVRRAVLYFQASDTGCLLLLSFSFYLRSKVQADLQIA